MQIGFSSVYDAIKKIVKEKYGARITEDAVEEIAAILEKKAKNIASYAVKRALEQKRQTITEEDIEAYELSNPRE